jgi:hypothetical protein
LTAEKTQQFCLDSSQASLEKYRQASGYIFMLPFFEASTPIDNSLFFKSDTSSFTGVLARIFVIILAIFVLPQEKLAAIFESLN